MKPGYLFLLFLIPFSLGIIIGLAGYLTANILMMSGQPGIIAFAIQFLMYIIGLLPICYSAVYFYNKSIGEE